MKHSGHFNPSEETGTGCPVTSKYGKTPPNKHGNLGRQQQQQHLCECGTKGKEIHVFFECKFYDQMRRIWLRVCDGLDEKKKMDVIKGYMEVNENVERHLGDVWMERKRNERNRIK